MIASHGAVQVAVLVGLGLTMLELAPRRLRRRAFTRSPRQGLFAWFGLLAAGMLGLGLAALSALLATPWGSGIVGDVLHLCAPTLQMDHRLPAPTLAAALAAAALVSGALSLALSAAVARREVRRDRRRIARRLLAQGAPCRLLGPAVVVVDDPKPLAFCLTAPRRIVVTSGALERLDEDELRAVLAHEHAHLDGRHHLIVMAADVVARAFPWLHGPATARAQIAQLCEMLADDAAVATYGPAALVGALGEIGDVRPGGALGAGASVVLRARRLVEPSWTTGGSWRTALGAATGVGLFAAVLALPLLDVFAGSCTA